MMRYRVEDEADRWLREHDPYYTDKSGHKSKSLRYPYDTLRQERTKAEIEIPISNLSGAQRIRFSAVAGAFDDEGNFAL